MEIIRVIDKKYNHLFDKESLDKRNCFVVIDDNKVYTYRFEIYECFKATIFFDNSKYLDEVINEFRFYAFCVTNFFDEKGNGIKTFDKVLLMDALIDLLQPSQFYIDEEKLDKIESWIFDEQIAIPIVNKNGSMVILDGHTRLYSLKNNGFNVVKVYLDTSMDEDSLKYIDDFSYLAREMNITKIDDLKKVSHEEYKILWNDFCDEYFKRKKAD